jgi:hypothetical protein
LITVPVISSALVISVLYENITGYIKLLGGFCSTIISYVLPGINFILILGLIYIKANNYPLYHWKNISTIILITICGGIGFSSGVITLLDIIYGRKH